VTSHSSLTGVPSNTSADSSVLMNAGASATTTHNLPDDRLNVHFVNFYVSHGSATRFSKDGEKYYIYFVDNLLLFPTVKEFTKSLNTWWSYCKNSTARFLRHSVYTVTQQRDILLIATNLSVCLSVCLSLAMSVFPTGLKFMVSQNSATTVFILRGKVVTSKCYTRCHTPRRFCRWVYSTEEHGKIRKSLATHAQWQYVYVAVMLISRACLAWSCTIHWDFHCRLEIWSSLYWPMNQFHCSRIL